MRDSLCDSKINIPSSEGVITINNIMKISLNHEVTAHVDYPEQSRFLGSKELETIFVPERTIYKKETLGEYQFDYFFVRCYRDDVESWLSLDQLKKIFGFDSVLATAEFISGKIFTIRTTKKIVYHKELACEQDYFSIINIK